MDIFKKIVLSTAVIAISFGYSVYQSNTTVAQQGNTALPPLSGKEISNVSDRNTVPISKTIRPLVVAKEKDTQVQKQQTSPKPKPKPKKPQPAPVVPQQQKTPTPPVSQPKKQLPVATPKGQYVDGSYTGDSVNAYYGYVQVRPTIKNGKIVAVTFLRHPDNRSTSQYINQQAMPLLEREAISAQSAKVSGVSGASYTSKAFRKSLATALVQAKNK